MLPLSAPNADGNGGWVWLAVIVLITVPPALILRRHLTGQTLLSYAALGLIAAVLANLQGDCDLAAAAPGDTGRIADAS